MTLIQGLKVKKNEITPSAATWMDLDCHTHWSKSDWEREVSHDIPYMQNLKEMIQVSLFVK